MEVGIPRVVVAAAADTMEVVAVVITKVVAEDPRISEG